MNYFELFNLPEKFKINKQLLSHNFYKLQLIYHPDLFIDSSISQKKIILKKSIEINKGYKVLKNFLSRAKYLLCLYGFNIDNKHILLNNNDFLLKNFSLYEELESIKQKEKNKVVFDLFCSKIERQIKQYKNKIEIELDNKNWRNSIKIISKLMFFLKIERNLREEKKRYLKQIN